MTCTVETGSNTLERTINIYCDMQLTKLMKTTEYTIHLMLSLASCLLDCCKKSICLEASVLFCKFE